MSEETYHWRAVILFFIIAVLVLPLFSWIAPDSVKSTMLSSITNNNPLFIFLIIVLIVVILFGGFAVFIGEVNG